jgi:hypothetical protein
VTGVDLAALEAAYARAVQQDVGLTMSTQHEIIAALPALLAIARAAEALMNNIDGLGGFKPSQIDALRSALAGSETKP